MTSILSAIFGSPSAPTPVPIPTQQAPQVKPAVPIDTRQQKIRQQMSGAGYAGTTLPGALDKIAPAQKNAAKKLLG